MDGSPKIVEQGRSQGSGKDEVSYTGTIGWLVILVSPTHLVPN